MTAYIVTRTARDENDYRFDEILAVFDNHQAASAYAFHHERTHPSKLVVTYQVIAKAVQQVWTPSPTQPVTPPVTPNS